MSEGLLNQEEIDALLGAANLEPAQAEITGPEAQQERATGGSPEAAIPAGQQETAGLREEEKDALGEIGNICMGSASTTLSLLLNQKVSITSPSVSVTTVEELFESFSVPYMIIYIQYIEGLSGFNLLMIRLGDAAVLADLMMGGDGTNVSEELTDVGVSAASEAMNQMIGTASTSMASMFGRIVNISPPETIVYRSAEDISALQLNITGPVVVVSFKMTIGDILDTRIMQIMGIDTAVEEANFILRNLYQDAGGEQFIQAEPPVEETAESLEAGEFPGQADGSLGALTEDITEPEPLELAAARGSDASTFQRRKPAAEPAGKKLLSNTPSGWDQERLDIIMDIPLKVTVLLGRTRWPIKDILEITPGSVIELQSMVDEPVEILVNGVLVAVGEVVVVNENFGVRITGIFNPEERLRKIAQRMTP